MRSFEYAAPETVAEAVALLASRPGEARGLAGGTDLITQLKEGRRRAALLVDLKRIGALNHLEFTPAGGLRIGAAVPCVRLQESPDVRQHYPILAYVSTLIGSYQIQNRASLGGNLCNAAPSADGVPPLIALGARAVLAGPDGERTVDVEAFCTGPGRSVLGPGEILVELLVPPPGPRTGSVYQRFIPRGEMDIAVAGVASLLAKNPDGTVARARIVLSAVAPTPLRVPAAEAVLQGYLPTHQRFEEAGRIASAACSPITDVRGTVAYRRHLVGVLTRRTLITALELAGEVG